MPINPALVQALMGQQQGPSPQGDPSPMMQNVNMKETYANNAQDAQYMVQQLKQQGFQAYANQLTDKGEHVIRFWPLNDPRGMPNTPFEQR